jgi:hypothetical protein
LFFNDKKQGRGALYFVATQSKYLGDFANDMKHGYGQQFNQNQLVYEGEWQNNIPKEKRKLAKKSIVLPDIQRVRKNKSVSETPADYIKI